MQKTINGYDRTNGLTEEVKAALRKISPPDDVITPDILRGLKNGDHESYKTVYLHWRKPIHAFILNLMGSEEEADDITQDIFTVLWQYRDNIDPEKNIRSFLYLLARRNVYDKHRLQKTREKYAHSTWFEEIDESTSYDIIVEKEAELLKRIRLRKMPPQQRRIFEMCHDEGLSPEEVAARLDIKRETVYNQLSKARKEIRESVLFFLLLFALSASDPSLLDTLNSILKF